MLYIYIYIYIFKIHIEYIWQADIVARAGFKRAKIFTHNTQYLDALEKVGMKHLVVSIPNHELVGYNAKAANALVHKLTAYAGITFDIVVGNEPLASWYGGKYLTLILRLTLTLNPGQALTPYPNTKSRP